MATFNNNLINRNVTINGRRTSLRLEEDAWEALEEICGREALNVHDVCTLVERHRHGSNRTSAVRAFILSYFRKAATDTGHRDAGHGTLRAIFEGSDMVAVNKIAD